MQNVDKSIKPDADVCQEVHSHHNLLEIFTLLWSSDSPIAHIAPRGSFVDMVFRIILFHQSFLGMTKYRPIVELTDREKFLYSDPSHYRYQLVMMINDASSYSFLYPDEDAKKTEEFKKNIDIQIDEWMTEYEKVIR